MAMVATSLLVTALALLASGLRAMSSRGEAQLAKRLGTAGTDASAAPGRRTGQALARLLSPIARLAQPKGEEENRLRLQLAQAGLRSDSAPVVFLALKMILACTGLGLFVWISAARAEPLPFGPMLAVLPFAGGFYAPNAWISRRIAARQTAIDRGLPDALDLLVTCVEAGLGLDMAFQRVATELALPWPVLSEELRLTYLEVNAGIRRVEALRRLARRTGVAELKSLAATLNQTEVFGTSISSALRIQADSMRVRRMQRAEERAGVVAVKLMLPLVLFILPSLIAVIMGPAVVNIVNGLFPLFRRH